MEQIERSRRIQALRNILNIEYLGFDKHVPYISIPNTLPSSFDKVHQSLSQINSKINSNIMIMLSDVRELLTYYSTVNIHSISISLGKLNLIQVLLNPDKKIVVNVDYYEYFNLISSLSKTQPVFLSQIFTSLFCLFFILLLFK